MQKEAKKVHFYFSWKQVHKAKLSEKITYFFHFCLMQKIDAMKSEKKRLFSAATRETYVKRISFRLVSLRSENKFEAKPAHPSPISHFPPALQYIVYYSLG